MSPCPVFLAAVSNVHGLDATDLAAHEARFESLLLFVK